ncbi:late cornified envelope protein 6A [Pteropus medius]|uniref:late cornified envelope protein 6A n=1 Tax=Pteropus vampyrus TaxID=132908 RepID=UPI00196AED27|nr:late cornified envelope protein 6A [Pteropus giganteus]
MSQQKQQPWEPPKAPERAPPQCAHPSSAPCSAPRCAPCSPAPQSSQAPGPARARRAPREPRCLRGGSFFHIREEEC